MWQTVDSSMMNAVRFNPQALQLDVEFNTGKCFRYENVTQAQFDRLISAESIGKEFQRLIRSQPNAHPYQTITKS